MRIVGGVFRGTALASVGAGDAKAHLRPTTDRVRESLFNLLSHGPYGQPIDGAVVLDLFAGTGALGFEALSRGAATATFVDDGRKAGALVAQNIKTLRVSERARLLRKDAVRLGPRPDTISPATLVFVDPPYGKGMGARALEEARKGGWLASEALVILEENTFVLLPEGFRLCDQRRYGDTFIHIAECNNV